MIICYSFFVINKNVVCFWWDGLQLLTLFVRQTIIDIKIENQKRQRIMIFSKTPTFEGHPIRECCGMVTGETIK